MNRVRGYLVMVQPEMGDECVGRYIKESRGWGVFVGFNRAGFDWTAKQYRIVELMAD